MPSTEANGMRGYHFVVNKATLECTVVRNVLDVGVCTNDFSQKVIKLAAYVLNRHTARK